MITKFKIFEKKSTTPNLNSVRPEFWKMIEIADWKKVIEGQKKYQTVSDNTYREFLSEAKGRVYNKYSYKEVKNFGLECDHLYYQLYDYFEPIWLDKLRVSDDSYWDLVTSVVGLGKEFIIKCIENEEVLIKMTQDDYYSENFSYIFKVDEKEYLELKEKYNPFNINVRKYNL